MNSNVNIINEAIEGQKKQCPVCGFLADINANFCRICGYAMGENQQLNEPVNEQKVNLSEKKTESTEVQNTIGFETLNEVTEPEVQELPNLEGWSQTKDTKATKPEVQFSDFEAAEREMAATSINDNENAEDAFAKGLPDWSIVPPMIVVRRKKHV